MKKVKTFVSDFKHAKGQHTRLFPLCVFFVAHFDIKYIYIYMVTYIYLYSDNTDSKETLLFYFVINY